MAWTRALHFKSWANEIESRHTLPLLVRRLIRAVVPRGAHVVVPANEQVQRPGLDGIVEADTRNQFVPAGKSAWEMGVNSNKRQKANEDFRKRTDATPVEVQRESTFVFVTPREWQDKDDWAADKKKNSEWRDVIALDANDLEHWIELCPAVDVWFSTISGRRPSGLIDLSARWTALRGIASFPLRPQILLASREAQCTELLRWFDREPASILLRTESAEGGLDFLSALVAANREDSAQLERVFAVNSAEAWRTLSINREPIILVAAASLPLSANDISEAVTAGHHVLICGNRMASQLAGELLLPRQESHALTTELQECGFDDSMAHRLALGCCGSSSVLKRLLTRHPQTEFPEWSNDHNKAQLAPFALLGGWTHVDPEQRPNEFLKLKTPIDLTCIQEFLAVGRDSIEGACSAMVDKRRALVREVW